MAKQKMVATASQFPIVDALLTTPSEGTNGFIGICTNTSAPGQVLNEIEEQNRQSISVLGSLIVSRDGTERMILNCLAHPTLKYLVLFSEESLTFAPSTNLLLALQHGINTTKPGNYINKGRAASAHYPNLSQKIVDAFRDNVVVIPMFAYKNDFSKPIVLEYLEWLKPKINEEIYAFLKQATEKKAIYYDALNKLIAMISKLPVQAKESVNLDPKEFQHLQPPKVPLAAKKIEETVPFKVSMDEGQVRLDIKIGSQTYFLRGKDEFRMEYSLMKYIKDMKDLLTPLQQLTIGAELARVDAEVKNNMKIEPFVTYENIVGKIEIPLESNISLITDKQYYYKIGVRGKEVSVMCLAFDVCEEVFDLRSPALGGIFLWMAEKNRFQKYEMDILHRIDIGGQIGRAAIAAKLGYAYIQDFSAIFKINKKDFPLLITQGDNFLDVHKNVLMKLYTQGLTEQHGDKQKGLARTAINLAIYRNTSKSLANLPAFYKQGEQSTKQMRENYKKQLLRLDHDGDYSYGERTRVHFGFDQILNSIKVLKKNPGRATVIQRFDPTVDMGSFIDKATGKRKFTHDPCLVYDIFIPKNGRLHSFHIARAHNMVNAYPENIFGLHDAYATLIREKLKLKAGDLYMLSNRGNILLLTEEQRTKKILMEPSKPADDLNTLSGPYELSPKMKAPDIAGVVAYTLVPLKKTEKKPQSKVIDRLTKFEGVDTVKRAIEYYKLKGGMHNNPVLSEYQAGKNDPQADQLVFFQANVMGGKVQATGVFQNRSIKHLKEDREVLNYLASKMARALKVPLGNLCIFYVGYTN